MSILVTLITRKNCHLCDVAYEEISKVIEYYSNEEITNILVYKVIDVDSNSTLQRKYSEYVPVVLINDRIHNWWHVDAEKLKRDLGEIIEH